MAIAGRWQRLRQSALLYITPWRWNFFDLRSFLTYWGVPNLAVVTASLFLTFLSLGPFEVTSHHFTPEKSVYFGAAFQEQWQIWLVLSCAHVALSAATIAYMCRLLRDNLRPDESLANYVIVIASLATPPVVALFSLPIHQVIFPAPFTDLLGAVRLPRFGIIDALTASDYSLSLIFSITLVMGNFAIFTIIKSILPAKEDTAVNLAQKYRTLRSFTYLTSSIFVLTTLIIFLWAHWPVWQMDWARAAELKGPPPTWAKGSNAPKSGNERDESGDAKKSAAKFEIFHYERGRYAAVASGFVTTFAIVYMMLILFYFLLPKSRLDSASRFLWEGEKSKVSFRDWQENNELSSDWSDKLKIALAATGPLLAAPLAELASSLAK